MKYKILGKREQKKVVREYLLQQEREHYCHAINLARYAELLRVLPDGEFRTRIGQLHAECQARMAEVEAIVKATIKVNT